MTKKQQEREERLLFMLALQRFKQYDRQEYHDILETARKTDALIYSAKQLRRIYERQCNGYQNLWTHEEDVKAREKDERKEERLIKSIQELVSELSDKNLVAVFQGDPRGPSAKLVVTGTEHRYHERGSVEVLTVPDWL